MQNDPLTRRSFLKESVALAAPVMLAVNAPQLTAAEAGPVRTLKVTCVGGHPDDPESGCLYIYDRSREAFYSLALPIDGRFGGFREEEFDGLCQTFGLKALASDPRPLRA